MSLKPIAITASTTLDRDVHANGAKIVLNVATGATLTLPASTGGGDQYDIAILTSVTSNNYVVQVANSTDVMAGTAILFADAGDTVVAFNTAASSDTITMDGTTRGGLRGASLVLTDIASGVWQVQYVSDASGTEATPFSAAV